jgi:peptide chain release factor 2
LANCGGFFDLPKLQSRLTELESRMAAADFWSNRERAQGEVEEVSRLRGLINPMQDLQRAVDDFEALQQLAAEESNPAARADAEKEIVTEHARLVRQLEEFELRQFLSGENDHSNAFVTIHSGAGGTESCDWADMLLRMYQRWIERSGFSAQTIDIQQGEGSWNQIDDVACERRIRLRVSEHRARGASPRADFTVRCKQAAAHLLRER